MRRPNRWKAELLNEGLRQAELVGLANVSRPEVAKNVGVSEGQINWTFGTMEAFRDAIVQHAVVNKSLRVIAEGLAARRPAALAATQRLKAQAVKSLI